MKRYDVGYSGMSLCADDWKECIDLVEPIRARLGCELLYSGHAIRTDSRYLAETYCKALRNRGADASVTEV